MFFQDDGEMGSSPGDVQQEAGSRSSAGDPADQALVGQVLGGVYHLTDLMVCGGYGAVYEGREVHSAKPVAVKVLKNARVNDPEAYEFFGREAEVLGRMVGQPGIVALLDQGRTGEDQPRPYLVLEYLDGWPLCVLTARGKPQPVEAAVWIIGQVCRALEALHRAGIIWRDCKPENVFLCIPPQGPAQIKLFDFGLAISDQKRQVNSPYGHTWGTPAYMAPEQASGGQISVQADIYSVGVLLYQLLAGRVPLEGKGPMETMTRVVFTAPLPIQKRREDLPPDLAAVVMTALAKRRKDRFSTVQELREWVELCVPQAAGETPPPALLPILEALKR